MSDADSELTRSRERIRESAKWLTASVGGVAVVLAAGTQLSSLGSLAVGGNRFGLAILGGVLAVVGAGLVMWWTIAVLTAPTLGLDGLADSPPPGTEGVLEDPLLLAGSGSAPALRTRYTDAVVEREAAFEAHRAAPTDAELRARAAETDAAAVDLRHTIDNLLDAAAYEALAALWRRARTAVFIGAALGAVGIAMTAWAANPPEGGAGTAADPVVLTEPEPATLHLTETGREALAEPVGAGCDLDGPVDVLLLGTGDSGPDVLLDDEGCASVRLLLVPAWGSVEE